MARCLKQGPALNLLSENSATNHCKLFMLAFCPLIVRICWELSSNDDLACFSNAFALRRVEGQTLLTHHDRRPADSLSERQASAAEEFSLSILAGMF